MREKVIRVKDAVEVIYEDWRWSLLHSLREKAREIMKKIPYESFVHGSVARGDVKEGSDVDIVIPYPVPTYSVEVLFPNIYDRVIVMATPNTVPKAHIYLEEKVSITIPLVKFSRREEEFYSFAGKVGLEDIRNGRRVMGVNKKLLAIEPTEKGHVEYSIIGREGIVAKKLNIGLDVIEERIRVLTTRDKIGRTGVFLKTRPAEDESFEEHLEKISHRNPAVKRIMEERG